MITAAGILAILLAAIWLVHKITELFGIKSGTDSDRRGRG